MPTLTEDAADTEVADNGIFTRGSFLKGAGAAVFALVTWGPLGQGKAWACTKSQPPPGCGPSPECCCCNAGNVGGAGGGCCDKNCTPRTGECGGAAGGWTICYAQQTFFCKDYWSDNQRCICRIFIGPSC